MSTHQGFQRGRNTLPQGTHNTPPIPARLAVTGGP